jgi:hypothetical protein
MKCKSMMKHLAKSRKEVSMGIVKIVAPFALLWIAVFFLEGRSFGQNVDLKFESTKLPAVTQSGVKLRESPPSEGFLFVRAPGKETSTLSKDQKVTVVDHKVVSTLFGNSVWVKVQAHQPTGQTVEGWAYWGPETDKSQTFSLLAGAAGPPPPDKKQ